MTGAGKFVRFSILMMVFAFGIISIMGKKPTPPGPDPVQTGCSDITLDYVNQPSAAMAWAWSAPSPGHGGHNWGTISRTGWEKFTNTEYIPQSGWPVPNDTQGLVFDMHMRYDGGHVGPFPSGYVFNRVVYLLEYTFPSWPCDASVNWGTDISVELPNGLCVTDGVLATTCRSIDNIWARYQLFHLSDPEGKMGVNGSGRLLLNNAILSRLGGEGSVPFDEQLWADGSTTRQYLSNDFSDIFTVKEGVQSHIYVGVAAELKIDHVGMICHYYCTTQPGDKLQDRGVFLVESKPDGAVSIIMTPSPQ